MTWAEIQTHDLLPATAAPVNSDHQPYMELDELLDAYFRTHVIFVDPKTPGLTGSFRTELIAILKNHRGWEDRFVAKSVPGDGNDGWLSQARAAGFVTNAMFYPFNDFETYYAQGDILGMEYTADQSVWDDITALGKPVLAHICPNEAAVATGLGKGAVGVVVSGVVQVPRVPGL